MLYLVDHDFENQNDIYYNSFYSYVQMAKSLLI